MKCVKILLAIVASLGLAAAGFAQGNPTGTVSGRVMTQDGSGLPGATVTATSPNLQGPRAVTTTDIGYYIIPFLPPGAYTLTFEATGFQTTKETTLVTAAGTITLDAKMRVGGVTEAITVTGSVADAITPGVAAA